MDYFKIRVFLSVPAAVVGLEEISYRVVENEGVVEVCVVVYSPIIECPIEFPFSVSLSTLSKNNLRIVEILSVEILLSLQCLQGHQITTRQGVAVVYSTLQQHHTTQQVLKHIHQHLKIF